MVGENAGRVMKSRSVSCALPALVAMALVAAGCSTTGTPQAAPPTTTTTSAPPVTTTSKPPVTTTTEAPRSAMRATPTTTTTAAGQPTAVGICVDTTTTTRVADGLCDTADTRYATFWYQHTDTLLYPAVGAAVALAAGSFLRPTGANVYDRGVPATGGPVTRGGLGQSRADPGGSSGS